MFCGFHLRYIFQEMHRNLIHNMCTEISFFKVTIAYDDVIKWKHFPRYWPFVRRIHRSSVNSPHKGQWRGALMFSLICAWTNSWTNNWDADDLRCHCTHYDVTVMISKWSASQRWKRRDISRDLIVHCDKEKWRPISKLVDLERKTCWPLK